VVDTLDSQSVLLERDVGRRAGDVRSEGRVCVPFGTPVVIPAARGRWVFGSIDIQPAWSGEMLALLAKPAEVRVTLQTPQETESYRLITPDADDGVFLSSFLTTAQTVTSAFMGTSGTPITTLTLNSAVPWEWQTPVCIAFTSLAPPTP
jgi:hypothetical protein